MRLITQRVPLSERPLEVLERSAGGHGEADLMLFRRPSDVVLVAQERASRVLIASRHPHHRLHDSLHMQTFFCDAHAPWQKGASKMP